MHTIAEMLEENARRKERVFSVYDPLSSLGKTSRGRKRKDEALIHEDFAYWAATRARIKNKEGGEDVPLLLNHAQTKLVGALEEMRRAGRPIRLILLKARQWGGSTCIQLYMAWLQLMHRTGLNSLIIAHQSAATDEIKDMFDRLVQGLTDPDCKHPVQLHVSNVGRSRAIFRIEERNAKVKVGTAERPDACRGGDYSLVHCSEVAIWKSTQGKTPEQVVRSACSGVLLKPMTMIVYESTANGTGNFFHSEYEAACRGESQFTPLFIPWYDIPQYTLPLDNPEEFARELLEARECEAASSDRREPGAYLWWLWQRGATLEGINWYVSERSKYGEHAAMASEYPSDDVEAFVHSGERVFDRYLVESFKEATNLKPETGEIFIPSRDGIAFNSSRADRAEIRRALKNVTFKYIDNGGWKIWKHPDTGERYDNRYLVCVDVGGRGIKADWSVIAVFDRLPMLRGEGPEIVAQWRGHTDHDLLAMAAVMAAAYYHEALLVIESNTLETSDPARDTDGDQSPFLLNRIREIYDNLYARRPNPESVRPGTPARYGFHTNAATKPMIISTLVQVIREGLYVERDPMCLKEYLTYERRQNGSYGAIVGAHDDLVMTRAIGLHISMYEMEAPRRTGAADCAAYYRRKPSGGSYSAW